MSDKSLKKLIQVAGFQKPTVVQLTRLVAVSILSLYLVGGVSLVSGYGPNDPECFELGDCDLFAAPFDAMIEPFDAVFQDFTLVVVWGIIIGILWLRVSNPMMVGIVGVGLAALFTRPDANGNLTGFSDEAQAVGWGLLILAIVVALYQILTVRVHFPTN